MREKNSNRGFTLIELVITMTIIGIIAYVAAQAITAGTRTYFSTDYRKEALDQARVAMERMTREVRTLRDSSSVITSSSTRFNFTDSGGNNIDFNYANPNITRNGNTLATGISAMTFAYVRNDGTVDAVFSPANTRMIRITITATVSGENLQLESGAFLRNL